MAATVLVYETVVGHENRLFRWQVVTDGERVRFGDDADRWRLFDTRARTIVFIDDTRRTQRTVTFEDALASRERLLAASLPEGAPRAVVSEEPAGIVDGREATRVTIVAGGYKRTLVYSTASLLPAPASVMKWTTDPIEPEYAGVIRDLMPAIVSKTGTLLADRNEIAYEGGAMAVETRLVSVERSRLPRSLFQVPAGFRSE